MLQHQDVIEENRVCVNHLFQGEIKSDFYDLDVLTTVSTLSVVRCKWGTQSLRPVKPFVQASISITTTCCRRNVAVNSSDDNRYVKPITYQLHRMSNHRTQTDFPLIYPFRLRENILFFVAMAFCDRPVQCLAIDIVSNSCSKASKEMNNNEERKCF